MNTDETPLGLDFCIKHRCGAMPHQQNFKPVTPPPTTPSKGRQAIEALLAKKIDEPRQPMRLIDFGLHLEKQPHQKRQRQNPDN